MTHLPGRRERVLEAYLANPDMECGQLADIAKCSRTDVRRILVAYMKQKRLAEKAQAWDAEKKRIAERDARSRSRWYANHQDRQSPNSTEFRKTVARPDPFRPKVIKLEACVEKRLVDGALQTCGKPSYGHDRCESCRHAAAIKPAGVRYKTMGSAF